MAHRAEPGDVLAVIPARGGSKGLSGKNLRLLAGVPLVEHALRFVALCPDVTRTIVSTEDAAIAATVQALGADAPFVRPVELAADDTAMWPVLRHALDQVDPSGSQFEYLLLVDPTSPVRDPAAVGKMLGRLQTDSDADGIVSVADPSFSPVWQTVMERDGYMAHVFSRGAELTRRQDAPTVYVIDGSLYLWRTSFVRQEHESWFNGRTLMQLVESAGSIDTLRDLSRIEALLESGFLTVPWLARTT